ncbi:hypothetical protein L4C36_22935 [Photobacterium japonica]|uniref:hypothetical protein n=1 Tax=Photobacterium japonica TaxID=2910235 RepID=UPI003D0BFBEB
MTYFSRSWHGNIAIWQAVVLNGVLGFILTFMLGALLGLGVVALQENGFISANIIVINNGILCTLFLAYTVFAVRSAWTTAKQAKQAVSHGLTKCWAVLLGLYMIGVIARMLGLA